MNLLDWSIFIIVLFLLITFNQIRQRRRTSLTSIYEPSTLYYGFKILGIQTLSFTFISLPGIAYYHGMTFLQFFLGIPLAIYIICAYILPKFKASTTTNAFEFIEEKLGTQVSRLAVILFIIQKILLLSVCLYATSIILSLLVRVSFKSLLLIVTFICISLAIIYKQKTKIFPKKMQLLCFITLMIAIILDILYKLPDGMGFNDVLKFADSFDKLKVIVPSLSLKRGLTYINGMVNGTLLFIAMLSLETRVLAIYNKTKYSSRTKDSLIMNGLFNIPLQALILFTGCMLFTFYQFNTPKLHYNPHNEYIVMNSPYAQEYDSIQQKYNILQAHKQEVSQLYTGQIYQNYSNPVLQYQLVCLNENEDELHKAAQQTIRKANGKLEINDSDFILLDFIINEIPAGITGFVIALFLISMIAMVHNEVKYLSQRSLHYFSSNTTTEINTSIIQPIIASVCLLLALALCYTIPVFSNLFQMLWCYSSLFFGTILGLLLIAILTPNVHNLAVLYSGILTQISILILFFTIDIHYIWYNSIGVLLVLLFTYLFHNAIEAYQIIKNNF